MTDETPPIPPGPAEPPGLPLTPPPPPPPQGPPWELDGTFLDRFVETVRQILLDPNGFFAAMRTDGGYGPPIVFGLIGSLAGGVFGFVWQLFFTGLGATFQDPETVLADAAVSMSATVIVMMFLPLLFFVSLFVGSAIYHVLLLLFGAATRPFEATLRVVAYASGSTSLLQVLPFCGGFIAAIWSIVLTILGLAAVHRTSVWTAVAVVLLPTVLCCAIGIFLGLAAVGLVLAGLAGAAQ